ncbi:MAG TPA: YajQ family cyclic di-GMP-binding protein [Vicinamibacterales bacterium]|nr:YajQ family cyclic di-GMP-binding protein [Vicinamibacterales bacterium]
MAQQASFDVTSTVDLQEVDNAVNQAKKELGQRYDFKGSKSSIDFKRAENVIELVSEDDFKLDAVWDILQTRLFKRSVPLKNLKPSETEPGAGGLVRRTVTLQQGIPTEAAREIVKFLKDQKMRKVQAAIQGDQLRVSSASKDELQTAIKLLKSQDFGIELQFGNYRG